MKNYQYSILYIENNILDRIDGEKYYLLICNKKNYVKKMI